MVISTFKDTGLFELLYCLINIKTHFKIALIVQMTQAFAFSEIDFYDNLTM